MKLIPLPPGPAKPAPTPPVVPAPQPPEPEAVDAATPSFSAARFSRAGDALAFLAELARRGAAPNARCLRRDDGKALWVEVEAPWTTAGPIIWGLGGRPFAGAGSGWVSLPADGAPPAGAPSPRGQVVEGDRSWRLDGRWREVDLAELAAGLTLAPASGDPQLSEAMVVAPGGLGRLALRQARAFGLDVAVFAATLRPLAGGADRSALVLRLRAAAGPLPTALLRSLGDLPYVCVARVAGPSDALLVDVRAAAPAGSALLVRLIPPGEQWLLGHGGAWRVVLDGDELDVHTAALDEHTAAPLPEPGALSLPPAEVVGLVPAGRDDASVDALLLEGDAIGQAATLLRRRVAGPDVDLAHVIPGPGDTALLVGPSRLLLALPVGDPLTAEGPGPLYRPIGWRFSPPLPPTARARLFGVSADRIAVARVADGRLVVLRFDLALLRPAWGLWVADGPAELTAPSAGAAKRLRELAAGLPKTPAKPVLQRVIEHILPGRELDQTGALEEAARLRAAGRWVAAAELYERIGRLADAGKMFERAARE